MANCDLISELLCRLFKKLIYHYVATYEHLSDNSKCHDCNKNLGPQSRKSSSPLCTTNYHTFCAKQQVSPSSGYVACCPQTTSANQDKNIVISHSASKHENEPITVSILNSALDSLFTKFKAEIPSIVADSLNEIRERVHEIQDTLDSHEGKIKTLKSSHTTPISSNYSEEILKEISKRSRHAKNVILYKVPEPSGAVNKLASFNNILSTLSTANCLSYCLPPWQNTCRYSSSAQDYLTFRKRCSSVISKQTVTDHTQIHHKTRPNTESTKIPIKFTFQTRFAYQEW